MPTKSNSPDQRNTELSRRNVLKFSLAMLSAGFGIRSLFQPALAYAAEAPAGKTLVTYFSRTGNTRAVAEHIRARTAGELFELRTTHSYPEDYRATTEQARREQDSNFRPQLTAKVDNMDAYSVVFIGYPNWWGTLPMAYFTFLEAYNFAGKTLVPFCTHEGSGLGRGPADIAKLCPGAKLLTGFDVRGGRAAAAQGEADRWLKRLSLA